MSIVQFEGELDTAESISLRLDKQIAAVTIRGYFHPVIPGVKCGPHKRAGLYDVAQVERFLENRKRSRANYDLARPSRSVTTP